MNCTVTKLDKHFETRLNLKDFPTASLEDYGLEAQHPDTFACSLLELAPHAVVSAVREGRRNLVNPAKTVRRLLLDLPERGLERFAKALEPFVDSL